MANPLRVLFLVDPPDGADPMVLELERGGYDVTCARVATEDELRAALDRQAWDIMLAGRDVPRLGPDAALELVRTMGLDLPFLLIPATRTKEAMADRAELLATVASELCEAADRRTRRRSEQAADRLAVLVKRSADAILGLTLARVVTDWNPAAERLFGWREGEALGRPVSFLIPPDRRGESSRILDRIRRGETLDSFETVRLHKDGRHLDVDLTVAPIRSGSVIVGASVIARSLSEPKPGVHSIWHGEEQFRRFADAIPHIVWTAQPEGTLDFHNQRWFELTGQPRDHSGDENWLQFLHPDDVAGCLNAWNEAVQTGKPFETEYRLRDCRTGAYRWSRGGASPLREGEGRVVRWVGTCTDIHDQKMAEADLRASESRYQNLLDRIPSPLFVYDRQTLAYLAVNDATVRHYGYSREEFSRMKLTDIRPAEDIPALLAMLKRSESSFGDRGSWRHRKKDGTILEVEITTHAIEYGDRQANLALAHDVTERRRTAAERDRLLDQLRLQIERMPLAYLLSGTDFRYTRWNQAAEKMFGFTEAEVLGKHPFEVLVPAKSQAFVASVFARLQSGDMNAHGVSENTTKDGRTITCEWYNTPLLDEDGTFTGLLSLAQDITARREAEEKLRLRDRAIEAITQGILITDARRADDPIIYVSPSCEQMTGYTQSDFLGKNCRFLQGKETDPEVVAQIRKAIREARPRTVELLNYRKDGSTFWNELSISPVRDELGTLTNFIGVQTDVTERRQLQEQYHQAQKMEAIGQLAGGIAHDFNNLLTVISGYSEMLLQELQPDDPHCELVEEIHRAGERSAALTRQLLVFSRKQVVAPRVLDLNAVVIDAETMLRRMIGEDIRLETDLGPGPFLVNADPGQLEQVLMNLSVNARDAMPCGGRLAIETADVQLSEDYARVHFDAPSGRYALLTVSDTGDGMTPEVLARIWEPFFTTKGVGKGTGLGLAVVHGIVKQAGGHIAVECKPGLGTTFEVYLPRVEGSTGSHRAPADQRRLPRGTETVLLVEDEDRVRALTRHVLIDRGYKVLEASNGEEALQVADRYRETIHLLLTDVVMPGMGGRELADRFVLLHPEAKVLYVSGYTNDAIVRHGVLEAQVEFLQKPFSLLALALKVRAVLDNP